MSIGQSQKHSLSFAICESENQRENKLKSEYVSNSIIKNFVNKNCKAIQKRKTCDLIFNN